MRKGYLCLLLHAHLPFVRHPEEKYFLEENWLFEAITETYIPLLEVFERLVSERVDFRLTMSMTPSLITMLRDPLLQKRFICHIDRLIELSSKEIERTKEKPDFNELALMYHKKFKDIKKIYVNKYDRDLVKVFKYFQDRGHLEIVASCATHAFLPNFKESVSTVRAQIAQGIDFYKSIFGKDPQGFWLPECGYYPGLDELLKENGIKYFFLDTHGITHGDPAPRYNTFAPVYCPSGVAAFGRDSESSKQVWSKEDGFPGDAHYREYYRDIGHKLDLEYISPYIHPDGIRINTGIKYWRVTGNTEKKETYKPLLAKDQARFHSQDFILSRQKQIEGLFSYMDREPLVVAPFDAELFGHWWYEGIDWIECLLKEACQNKDRIAMITPSDYLAKYPTNQVSNPSASTWGFKGHNEVWLSKENEWIYRHLHIASERMEELVEKFWPHPKDDPSQAVNRRALNQAARELFLAQFSDWPFIIKAGTVVPYATRRVRQHINQFTRLYDDLLDSSVDIAWLEEVESRDNIFKNFDCAKYFEESKMGKKLRCEKELTVK